MLKTILSWFGSSQSQPIQGPEAALAAARADFAKAFASDLNHIENQRARHAQVKPSQAELQARVHDALARKLSA